MLITPERKVPQRSDTSQNDHKSKGYPSDFLSGFLKSGSTALVQNLPVLIGRLIPTYHHSRGKFWFDLKYKNFRVRIFFKANVGNDGCLKLIAENQNNFDNSNNSLVCFKAPDTFPRSVTFL